MHMFIQLVKLLQNDIECYMLSGSLNSASSAKAKKKVSHGNENKLE